jgi:hypothetical protein
MPERTAERSVAGLAHQREVRARKARTFPPALGRAAALWPVRTIGLQRRKFESGKQAYFVSNCFSFAGLDPARLPATCILARPTQGDIGIPSTPHPARAHQMPLKKPNDGEIVWVEYPEGKHFQAEYDAASDTYTAQGQQPLPANSVANWSREEREDYDISDDPLQPTKGRLTRS